MSFSNNPVHDRPSRPLWGQGGFGNLGARADWSPMNVAVMVIGFMLFWPLGLIVLGWAVSGRHVRDLPGAVRELWSRVGNGDGLVRSLSGRGPWSDNAVFNDYQQTQYDRIRELELELAERKRRFAEFRKEARRHADQDEFDRFMAEARAGTSR